SMGFGPVDRQKNLVLAEVATTLAHILAQGGNRVGAVILGSEVEQVIPPASGRNQVLRIARELIEAPTPPASGTTTDLAVLLRAAYGLARRRSLIVIVSDFISEPGWDVLLALLARRHEVVAIQVADPREFEIPPVGMVYVEDAETGEQIFVDTDDPGFQRRLREAAGARQGELVEATRSAGVDLHQVLTDEDLVRALMRISALRKRRRR
ncbi:MAG: VWA domain-containing protein, partial [Actinomycetota bacterium]